MPASTYPLPPYRCLRVYTYDPSIKSKLETVLINETTLNVPWEAGLKPGPVGDYLEVVDYDPASGCFYAPVDLNDQHVLAQDGLAPSEGNPQFHQQMVYAVAMVTIANFEKALGRKALWGRRGWDGKSRSYDRSPALRLRVYPHALREANAFYSPAKTAILFGYFPAALSEKNEPTENFPGGLVFTCLSHDVIAHETTHALLDGLHRYFSEDSNPDALAFHEAFADIVALFQHFSQPQSLQHQIAKTRGNLRNNNLLAELAHQFGQAVGNHGALRNAIGKPPTQNDYAAATEPHARGSVLVAALFDAFLAIYESRTDDLIRIATGGTGRLPGGHIHPDLVNRLAMEASKTASHLLKMAIRALDYCPPVDMTFGDYLRALVTGDAELMPDDPMRYRTAVIEGFRRRGIYPTDVRTLADDALRWRNPLRESNRKPDDGNDDFRGLLEAFAELGRSEKGKLDSWRISTDRKRIAETSDALQYRAWRWLNERYRDHDRRGEGCGEWWGRPAVSALGLALHPDAPRSIYRSKASGGPSVQVHSVRLALRPRQDGATIRDVVIEVVQRRRGYLDPAVQREVDKLPDDLPDDPNDVPERYRPDFTFRGGCTLLIDGESGYVRYVIEKDILSSERLERRRRYEAGDATTELGLTFSRPRSATGDEPFAMMHRGF